MHVALIAALTENGCIGRDGGMPWHLPDDLRHFKALTLGHPVIMGRRTFDEVGRPLPGRRNVVVTRQPDWAADGVETADSLEAAVNLVAGVDELWIIGGAQIYALALEAGIVDRLELTRIHAEIDGDTFFPPYDPAAWECTAVERREADDAHAHAFSFETYRRVTAALGHPPRRDG